MSIKKYFYQISLVLNLPLFIKKRLLFKLAELEGGEVTSGSLRKFYKSKYGINIGYGTYGVCFNSNNFPPNITIGNYCSIADGVKIFRANHPMDYFTTHPIFYNPNMGYVEHDQLLRSALIIGHDVWIGANSIITPSCKIIGNGAIIGAGSIVTKDVAPYSIVAGNPAKEIRKRFNHNQIEYLESSHWWNLTREELINESQNLQLALNSLSHGT